MGRELPGAAIQDPGFVEQPQVKADTSKRTSLVRLRGLLVEDNIVNQKIGSMLLERNQIQAIVASSGEEALEKIQSDPDFDFVLMDIQMPGMDGVETTQRIRRWEKENHLPRTPIIALTANAMESQKSQYLSAGMDGFHSKQCHHYEWHHQHDGQRNHRPSCGYFGRGARQSLPPRPWRHFAH